MSKGYSLKLCRLSAVCTTYMADQGITKRKITTRVLLHVFCFVGITISNKNLIFYYNKVTVRNQNNLTRDIVMKNINQRKKKQTITHRFNTSIMQPCCFVIPNRFA